MEPKALYRRTRAKGLRQKISRFRLLFTSKTFASFVDAPARNYAGKRGAIGVLRNLSKWHIKRRHGHQKDMHIPFDQRCMFMSHSVTPLWILLNRFRFVLAVLKYSVCPPGHTAVRRARLKRVSSGSGSGSLRRKASAASR